MRWVMVICQQLAYSWQIEVMTAIISEALSKSVAEQW